MKTQNRTLSKIALLIHTMLMIAAANTFLEGSFPKSQAALSRNPGFEKACLPQPNKGEIEFTARNANAKSNQLSSFFRMSPSNLSNDSRTNGFKRSLSPESDISFDESSGLRFQRFFDPGGSSDVGLGCGWTYKYSDKISVAFDRAVLTTGEGASVAFEGANKMTDRNTATMEFISRGSHDKSRRVFQFESINMLKENADGNVNTYVRFGEDFLLIRIKDGEGNETQIKRHLDGRIAQVSKNGDSIDLNWSESLHPRLLSLIDSKGRKVEFIYNEKELVAVENSGGRLLKYKYKRKNPNATKVARVVVFESRCAGCLSEDEPDDQN